MGDAAVRPPVWMMKTAALVRVSFAEFVPKWIPKKTRRKREQKAEMETRKVA